MDLDNNDAAITLLSAVRDLTDSLKGVNTRLDKLEAGENDDETSVHSTQHSDDDGTRGQMNASSLKQKKKLQEEVKARMSELQLLDEDSSSDSSNSEEQTKRKSKPKRSNKSGRNKTAEDAVAKEIDWPHYHVYRGSDRRAARYQDLSVEEFEFGYLSSVLYGSESDQTKQKMLSHLHELMRTHGKTSGTFTASCSTNTRWNASRGITPLIYKNCVTCTSLRHHPLVKKRM